MRLNVPTLPSELTPNLQSGGTPAQGVELVVLRTALVKSEDFREIVPETKDDTAPLLATSCGSRQPG
jgi:hypothetical protein